MNRYVCNRFLSILTVVATFATSSTVYADILSVELKDSVTVRSPRVLLRDVATIKSASFADQTAAQGVELRLLDLAEPEETITARSVATRLVLAGWVIGDIQLIGAPEVHVAFREPELLTDTQIETAAHDVAYTILGGDPDDFSIKLQSSFVQSLPPDLRDADGLVAKVIPSDKIAPGRCNLQIQVWDGDRIAVTKMGMFELQRRQTVAIARIALSRDKPIDERSVQFERRFLSTAVEELDPSQVFGQRVRTNIVAGSILQLRDFQTTPSGSQVLIKRGDFVTAYATAGRLQTRLRNVEAMQDGGLGDNIKLLNRDSDLLVSGKVVGPGAVRIIVER